MILITGGTGLVGAHLLYKLVTANKRVRALYRTAESRSGVEQVFSYYTENYKPLYDSIEWVEADLLDIPKLTEAFKNVSYVYHAAALISFAPNDSERLRKTNIEGTANIVNLCLSCNIKKLCYVSSIATLGDTVKNTSVNEDTDWNPEKDNSMYSITKYGAEMEVWRGTQEGLDAVIVNPGVIIGSGMWHRGSGQLFQRVYAGLSFYTSGHVACVTIDDVVSCMIGLLESTIKNERFILVASHIPYKDFLEHIAKALNKKPPTIMAKPWLLALIWRLDWLKHTLFRTPRKLTKQMVYSIQDRTHYNNTKVKTALGFKFTPVTKAIETVGNHFLQDKH
ncbi:NAD-dependent epimerase/dehydratase family protein [Bizionia sediminis]|uniref:NAD-dependent epimerase/dehydratase family protein n=1 Tax=Bizionia sediminis TaxID=1737064 RepID=A0ABW5KS39_9FLAO